jgi:hypothetical protein
MERKPGFRISRKVYRGLVSLGPEDDEFMLQDLLGVELFLKEMNLEGLSLKYIQVSPIKKGRNPKSDFVSGILHYGKRRPLIRIPRELREDMGLGEGGTVHVLGYCRKREIWNAEDFDFLYGK